MRGEEEGSGPAPAPAPGLATTAWRLCRAICRPRKCLRCSSRPGPKAELRSKTSKIRAPVLSSTESYTYRPPATHAHTTIPTIISTISTIPTSSSSSSSSSWVTVGLVVHILPGECQVRKILKILEPPNRISPYYITQSHLNRITLTNERMNERMNPDP